MPVASFRITVRSDGMANFMPGTIVVVMPAIVTPSDTPSARQMGAPVKALTT